MKFPRQRYYKKSRKKQFRIKSTDAQRNQPKKNKQTISKININTEENKKMMKKTTKF